MLNGSILQKLETAHRGSQRPLNLGVYYKNTLVALCHALEDFILHSRSAPLVITAFQRGKWYLQEAERYGEIAQQASQVAILAAPDTSFSEHPTSQLPNVELVSLDASDPVAQEWHLIILSPTYTAMVLCQELSAADYGKQGQPAEDLERKFYGFWTFEPALVQETVEIAIAHIGSYDRELQARLKEKQAAITAQFGQQEPEDVGMVVSQVVDYLQHSQAHLQRLQADRQASYLPQTQELGENLASNEMQAFLRMAQLIDQADASNPLAAAEVAALTEAMGHLLDLPAWQQKRLRLASLLHRLVPSLGTMPLPDAPKVNPQSAPSCELIPSIQALRSMPRLRAIARIITHQTERWDGSGTPGGLAYDAIPLESRILALASYFQHRVNDLRMQQGRETNTTPTRNQALSQALADCQAQAGTTFDPKLVEALEVLVLGMQQGMDIQANPPKIAAGMWLLDLHPEAEAQLRASSFGQQP